MFPGAVRGMSLLAPILTRAVETDLTIDAQLKQQQVAALLSVFLSDPNGGVSLGDITDGNKVELEPAAVRRGAARLLLRRRSTRPKPAAESTSQSTCLRSMAAGVGLPAWKVSADLIGRQLFERASR